MLTAADARPLITTSLSDEELEVVIGRERTYLARRIGPLYGERVETFVPAGSEILLLRRHAAAVVVADDNGDAVVALREWSAILLSTEGASWSGVVEATYEPDDEDEVDTALITLVRLRIAESAYTSQAAGSHSATYDPQAAKASRWSAWRSLLRPSRPSSIQLASTIPLTTGAIHSIATEASGS